MPANREESEIEPGSGMLGEESGEWQKSFAVGIWPKQVHFRYYAVRLFCNKGKRYFDWG